jgi:hypothetical protein
MTASVLILLAIVQQQHITPVLYGLIVAAGGIGNLLGTVLCPPFQRRMRFGIALGSTLIMFVLLWPLYGIVTTPLLLGVAFAGIAIFDSISAILMSSYRLSVVPDVLQGRVSGGLSPDPVQHPHHRSPCDRVEPRTPGCPAYSEHSVERPALASRVSVCESTDAAGDVAT